MSVNLVCPHWPSQCPIQRLTDDKCSHLTERISPRTARTQSPDIRNLTLSVQSTEHIAAAIHTTRASITYTRMELCRARSPWSHQPHVLPLVLQHQLPWDAKEPPHRFKSTQCTKNDSLYQLACQHKNQALNFTWASYTEPSNFYWAKVFPPETICEMRKALKPRGFIPSPLWLGLARLTNKKPWLVLCDFA